MDPMALGNRALVFAEKSMLFVDDQGLIGP